MNQRSLPLSRPLPREMEHSDSFIDLDRLLAAVLRHVKAIAIFTLVFMALGAAYLAVTTPVYTSMTQILLDDTLSRFAEDEEKSAQNSQQLDTRIASAVEILKSGTLAERVVSEASLQDNETLLDPPQSLASIIKSWLKSVTSAFSVASPVSEDAARSGREAKAAAMLQQGVKVERVARSAVVAVSYTSPDPLLAAKVARTYADAYLSDQLGANFDASERASVWLQERLSDLGQRAQAASMEVENYKRANNLTSARGELMSEQQLADLNSQLIIAQADAASASARYNQFKSIIDKGPENAVENATLSAKEMDGSVIQSLKERYLAVSKREADISSAFGPDHAQAVSLRAEKTDLSGQIFRELQQLTASYNNEYQVARSREESLRDSIANVAGTNSDANQSIVHLRELEQKADALKAVYESYLARYEQASQQRSFPIAKARVISDAGVPVSPSAPKKTMTLALSAVLGLMFGAAYAFFREMQERSFRLSTDVRSILGHKSLGYLPLVGKKPRQKRNLKEALFTKPDRAEAEEALPLERMTRIAWDAPRSVFAETLRNAKLACEAMLQPRPNKVIGVVSSAPNEGKTTVAANFAILLAASGKRTLLIDADLRNPGLSRMLNPPPKTGLMEALSGEVAWMQAVKVDQKTKLAVLPITPKIGPARDPLTNETLSSPAMAELIENARKTFDYVVVDLAPLGPVVDAKTFAPQADGFIFVVEWGKTPSRLVKELLDAEPEINTKILGVILNKTDMTELPKYSEYGGPEKFRKHYSKYYAD
ncbi:succinoglycan biosynthesis transport protein ExoP [Pararhizobium capsulatum DSM 1112]|uniref:non-specific protein-tyrosine kinase n=1 Tax=Pararhizobium capsulatum DSM 1112 TaxID=1121113 RepID=A0ABU0BW88_9HYPH|nr:polysaccharide biosynthesis tyrosine autokinase [Pararhizobium capsulatum]MDQ0322514.1 succinoglycan biosynthesis transport protein ExoP [Pararhizobium capsulatum DSM 1112]